MEICGEMQVVRNSLYTKETRISKQLAVERTMFDRRRLGGIRIGEEFRICRRVLIWEIFDEPQLTCSPKLPPRQPDPYLSLAGLLIIATAIVCFLLERYVCSCSFFTLSPVNLHFQHHRHCRCTKAPQALCTTGAHLPAVPGTRHSAPRATSQTNRAIFSKATSNITGNHCDG